MRNIYYTELKKLYADAGIAQDDFNIQMIAKMLTSYKRTNNGLEPINSGEKADVVTLNAVGNKNNIFKQAELTSGYKILTRPTKQNLKPDAANNILL